MQSLFRATFAPVLLSLAAFAACTGGANVDDDDDSGGQSGNESGGSSGAGAEAGQSSVTGGKGGSAGSSSSKGGSSGRGGGSSVTGGTTDAGGAPAGGESGADNGGSGAEAGDTTGSGGSSASGGKGGGSAGGASGGSGGSAGGASGGSGGSSGSAGASGSSGSGGSAGGTCGPISVEPLNHHLGDGTGSEGTTFSRTFNLACTCTSPWLSFQIDGPNRENPPHVYVNGSELPSVASFMPAVSSADVWQSNGGSSYDYNGFMQIHYDLGSRLVSGTNTFTITNGTSADDYNFQDVRVECGAATTPPGPDIVNRGGWVGYYDDRAGDDPAGIQGAFYAYSDGASCEPPVNPCTSGACCLSGSTLATEPSTNWGCGMGLQLKSSGGSSPVESAYPGPANCFVVEITGNSGGNEVRMQAATDVDMSTKTAPVYSLGTVNGTKTETVCFSDFSCPLSPPKPCSITNNWYRLELNVLGGVNAAAFDVCLRSLIPFSG